MSGKFHVDLDRLENIASRLAGLAGFMNDRFAELDRRVAQLHTGSWSGEAAAGHAEAHAQWSAGAGEFGKGVTDIRTAVTKAHGHYAAAVTANKRMLGGH